MTTFNPFQHCYSKPSNVLVKKRFEPDDQIPFNIVVNTHPPSLSHTWNQTTVGLSPQDPGGDVIDLTRVVFTVFHQTVVVTEDWGCLIQLNLEFDLQRHELKL